jgi:hypothetical protein
MNGVQLTNPKLTCNCWKYICEYPIVLHKITDLRSLEQKIWYVSQ